ncbi:hypothetical protein D3C78_1014290 [compost metagenome]
MRPAPSTLVNGIAARNCTALPVVVNTFCSLSALRWATWLNKVRAVSCAEACNRTWVRPTTSAVNATRHSAINNATSQCRRMREPWNKWVMAWTPGAKV